MDNIFMKVDGMEGSATSAGFEKQIGLYSLNHGMNLNCFAGGGTEGRTSGVCNHSDISITKVMDKNSVKFNELCCNATPIKNIMFTICRQEGDSLISLITITIDEALVSSYNVSCGGGGNPTESLTLNYTKIKWEFTEQKSDGTKDGKVAATWNLQKNAPK
jgi:type VI secretion system secreted protein Hcp